MNPRLGLAAGLVLLVVVACSGGATPSSTPAPTQAPTPGPDRTLPELKLALTDAYGPLWYCDPDFYPIQRAEEIESARERWPEVEAEAEAFAAITRRLGFDAAAEFTDDKKLTVYQAWKILNAIALDPIGNDTYRYDYLAQPAAGAAEGTRTAGTITQAGAITIEQQAPAGEPMCPICLAIGTEIETPDGREPVEGLRIGDTVWTLDERGTRMPATVTALGSMAVPAGHLVVRLVLADDRAVTASLGHPLADGRRLGDLRVGDAFDGSLVISADRVAYDGARTFDIAVSGPTGTYLVDGIPLGSTLRP
jgi:hypothetical protein